MIRKMIDIVLDVLLLVGAIAAVLTIDGGKVLSTGVNIYPSTEVQWLDVYLTQNSYENDYSPESALPSNCSTITLPAVPAYYNTFMIPRSSSAPGAAQDAPLARPGGCR